LGLAFSGQNFGLLDTFRFLNIRLFDTIGRTSAAIAKSIAAIFSFSVIQLLYLIPLYDETTKYGSIRRQEVILGRPVLLSPTS